MNPDFRISRVGRVSVAFPVGRMHVDFHVACDAAAARSETDRSAEKIRARFGVPDAGIFNDDILAGRRFEIGRPEIGIEPHALQVALGPREPPCPDSLLADPPRDRASEPDVEIRAREQAG